jgi:hypothetical protein
MSIRFRPLATLSITHDYYGGLCGDFDFVLPSGSATLMRAGRLLARQQDARLHLLFEAQEDNTPIIPVPGQVLRLGLRLHNPSFQYFTAPGVVPRGRVAFYANDPNRAVLSGPQAVEMASSLYAPAPQLAKRPVTLWLRDANGHALAEQTLAASAEPMAFDLRPLPQGAYTVAEDYGDEQRVTPLHLNPELAGAGLYGLVQITLDSSFYAAPPDFNIHFDARQETLKYYVVAEKYSVGEFDQLDVSDQGAAEDKRDEVTFEKILPDAFSPGDIAPALLGGTDARIALFQSRTSVARSSHGLRKIQLASNGDVLVEHLPQPGADRAQAHHIIHLSKP